MLAAPTGLREESHLPSASGIGTGWLRRCATRFHGYSGTSRAVQRPACFRRSWINCSATASHAMRSPLKWVGGSSPAAWRWRAAGASTSLQRRFSIHVTAASNSRRASDWPRISSRLDESRTAPRRQPVRHPRDLDYWLGGLRSSGHATSGRESEEVDRERLSCERLGELHAQGHDVSRHHIANLTEHERPVAPVCGL
jgi:hypothetical protein